MPCADKVSTNPVAHLHFLLESIMRYIWCRLKSFKSILENYFYFTLLVIALLFLEGIQHCVKLIKFNFSNKVLTHILVLL